jgi:hypothetical protein
LREKLAAQSQGNFDDDFVDIEDVYPVASNPPSRFTSPRFDPGFQSSMPASLQQRLPKKPKVVNQAGTDADDNGI